MAHWVSVWGQALTPIRGIRPAYRDRTCLLTVRSAFDGVALRLRFSNREGRGKLTIAGVTAAVGDGRPVRMTFGGEKGLVLAPGQETYAGILETPVRRGN